MGFLDSLFGKKKVTQASAPRPAILAVVEDARRFSGHVIARWDGLFEKDEKDMALSAYGFGAIQTLCDQFGRGMEESPTLCCIYLRKFFGYSPEESERRAEILAAAGIDDGSPLFPIIAAGKRSVCLWQQDPSKFDPVDLKELYEKLQRIV